jgi:Spy/CpxP family protein refolding chaperone
MMVTPNRTPVARRDWLTLALALPAIALGTFAVLELPAGPMPGDGLTPSIHAMHDGDIGPMLPQVLEGAKASLNLSPRQQRLWDDAAAQAAAAREMARPSRQQVKDVLTTELAKAEPDLKVVAGLADPVLHAYQTDRQQVRDLWLDLYAGFSPEQKAVVRDLLRERLARVEAYHDRLREQKQQRRGASGG